MTYDLLALNERCEAYDILRKKALAVTRSEWIKLARMFHRAYMETRDDRAKLAREIAIHNARLA